MWGRWRDGAPRRVIAGVVLLTLGGLLAGAVFAQLSYRRAAGQLIMQRDRQVAVLTAVRLGDELLKLADELQPTARAQSLYLGLTGEQRLLLRGQSQRLSVFDAGVVLLDSTGRVRATIPERWDIMSTDWSNQEFFRNMLVNPPPAHYFSSIQNVGPENSPVVVMSVPVLGEDGEMAGVLAGLFRLGESRVSAFYAGIVRLRLPGTGNTFIVDDRGRIIYDSGYQQAGQAIDLAALEKTTAGDDPEPRLDAQGNQVITSIAPIPGTNWSLVTETDWVQATAPVRRFATGIIVLLALGMVVPAAGVALLARGQRRAGGDADQASLDGRVDTAMRERLLPRFTPMLSGWEVAVHHQSASTPRATAHDLYDFMLLPDGRLMISLTTIADSGPLAGVYLMTTARAAFRTGAYTTGAHAQSAGHALSLCNNLLCPDVGPSTAITSLFALLDPLSGWLQLSNAGFCAPFRWSEGELIEMREGPDLLGQALDVQFDHDDVLVGPGESVIFYSPGALGVRPEAGDPFGPERVRRVMSQSGAETAQGIVDALRMDLTDFADASSLGSLDITFLVLSRPPASPGEPQGAARQRGVRQGAARSHRDDLAALGETETDL